MFYLWILQSPLQVESFHFFELRPKQFWFHDHLKQPERLGPGQHTPVFFRSNQRNSILRTKKSWNQNIRIPYECSFLKLMKSPTQINENNCHRRHLIQMFRHPICFDNSFWNKPFVRCSSGFWWFGKIISWIFNKEPPWKKSYIFFKLFFHEIKNISCINIYIILNYFQYRK